jgi:hypothetical protein
MTNGLLIGFVAVRWCFSFGGTFSSVVQAVALAGSLQDMAMVR